MFLLLLLMLMLLPSFLSAAEPSCELPKNYRDFFSCSIKRHPKAQIAQLVVEEADAGIDRASQLQNPDISVRSVGGTQVTENIGATEIALSIPLSQIWTRGPKKNVAIAEKRIAQIDSKQTILTVKRELIRDLFRLRQIDDDMELVTETLDAFDTIRRQLSARKARGPDQEITLSLVQLASSDYQLKKNHLQVERAEIRSKLRAVWGSDFELKKEFVPPLREKWPEISVLGDASHNLQVQKAIAESEKANAEIRLAEREALPTISAGPVLERTTTGPTQTYSYGVNVVASLPILT